MKGRKALNETLSRPSRPAAPREVSAEKAGLAVWHREGGDRRGDRYRLTLAGEALPGNLKELKVRQLSIGLDIGDLKMNVRHDWVTEPQAQISNETTEKIKAQAQTTVARAVNQLMAQTLAAQLAEPLRQFVEQRQRLRQTVKQTEVQAVRLSLTNQMHARLHASIRL
jgi:DNA-binding MarR family transcriptional regulator